MRSRPLQAAHNPFKKQKSVSNRTIFLSAVSSMLLLVTLFFQLDTLNPTTDKVIRGVLHEKQMEIDTEAAFAKIRVKVEREKIDYSEDWSVHDMRDSLNCEEIFKSERPIHSYTDWLFARSLYRDIVGSSQSSIGSSDGNVKNGFQYEVEAKQAPPKGRGIFALEDIKKGTLIWSTAKTARFQDGPSYRKFIFGLEAGFACDVLQWGKLAGKDSAQLPSFSLSATQSLTFFLSNLNFAFSSLCTRSRRWRFTCQCRSR